MDPVSRLRRPWEEGPAASAHPHQPNLHPADRTGPEPQQHVYAESGHPHSQVRGGTSPILARPGTTQFKEEPSLQSWTGPIADNTPSHVQYKGPVHEASPQNKRRRLDYGQWPYPAAREGFGHQVPHQSYKEQVHAYAKASSTRPVYHQQQSPQMTMNRPPYFGALPPNAESRCCDSNCKGRTCSTRRIMLAEILHLIQDLHSSINQHANPTQPFIPPPKTPRLGLDDGLAFALESLRVSAGTLQRMAEPPEPKPETRPPAISNAAALDELRNEMKHKAEQGRQATGQPPSSISLKTLALQTLRQEYDALLAKLDRQRTKCATLEKKFAVSDVELNTLTVDKEELEAKTQALEQQVEELREARDEARRDEVKTGEQYRTIVEMASRLQKGAADEKRLWAQEREALLRALRGEQAALSEEQLAEKSHTTEGPAGIITSRTTLDHDPGTAIATNQPERDDFQNASNQVIEALRVEVAQLRSRNQSLEAVLQKLQAEMGPMKTAACTIAEAQTRMEEAAGEALRVA